MQYLHVLAAVGVLLVEFIGDRIVCLTALDRSRLLHHFVLHRLAEVGEQREIFHDLPERFYQFIWNLQHLSFWRFLFLLNYWLAGLLLFGRRRLVRALHLCEVFQVLRKRIAAIGNDENHGDQSALVPHFLTRIDRIGSVGIWDAILHTPDFPTVVFFAAHDTARLAC